MVNGSTSRSAAPGSMRAFLEKGIKQSGSGIAKR
jgi:hypothetical protein